VRQTDRQTPDRCIMLTAIDVASIVIIALRTSCFISSADLSASIVSHHLATSLNLTLI